MYTLMSYADSDSLTFSLSLSFLTRYFRSSSIIYNKSEDNKNLCLLQNLRGNAFMFQLQGCCWLWVYFKSSFNSYFVESFLSWINVGYYRNFICIDMVILFLFPFIYVVYYYLTCIHWTISAFLNYLYILYFNINKYKFILFWYLN